MIPNKYPALGDDLEAPKEAVEERRGRAAPAAGRHEVIVETAHHDALFHRFDERGLLDILRTYRSRFAAAASAPSVQHVILFRNQGPLANASLTHPHSQLVALPFTPPLVEQALERSRRHQRRSGRPLLAALLEAERDAKTGIVREASGFTTLVPWAASFDYEIWLVPQDLPPRFDRTDDELLGGLCHELRACLAALERALDGPDYNLILQTPPLVEKAESVLPWYVQVIPRISGTAGFEIGAGVRILTVTPEAAAARLRSALDEVAPL